jgi:membrane-associated protein
VLASVGTWLQHFHGPPLYLVCGLLVFSEAAFLLGFVIPGETAAVAGGAVAALGHANLEVMIAVIVGCAIVGDSVGYEVGKVMGPYLLERRALARNVGVVKARALLVRYGGPAVFLGRWVALARALVPGLTGMSGMRYRTFLFYNALGGLVWGTTFVLLGYAAGRSWEAIAKRVGTYGLYVLAGLAVVAISVFVVRKRRGRAERARLIASGALGPAPATVTATAWAPEAGGHEEEARGPAPSLDVPVEETRAEPEPDPEHP